MADTAQFTLTLLSAEGIPADEPNATVRFANPDNTTVNTAPHVAFPPARTFLVPAWPAANALSVDLTFSRFRIQKSGFFTPDAAKPGTATVIAMREPNQWTPAFMPVANLPGARFGALQKVMSQSDQVDFKHGPAVPGRLDQAWDALGGEQALFAKMALLNLHAVMVDETDPVQNKPWFNVVQKIVRLDRERFISEVNASMRTTVATILGGLDRFKSQGFFTEPSPGLHLENFPDRYQVRDLITIKKRYQQGNVQFTVATGTTPNGEVTLLDCDMDENSQFLLHTVDLFRHPFSGGTHPIDMHEYIVAHSAASNGGVSAVDLGYTLMPAAAAPAAPMVTMAMAPASVPPPPRVRARKPRARRARTTGRKRTARKTTGRKKSARRR